MSISATARLILRDDPTRERRFRKYGRLGRMPGVIGVAFALGIVYAAKTFLPHETVISFDGASRRELAASNLLDSAGSTEMLHRRRLSSTCPELSDFDNNGGVIVWFLLVIYIFLGIAIICDEYFVTSLEEITRILKIPDDVAGATFMAAGSSAPEVATVVISTLINPGDEGLGDVVGAAVFNSMTVVGLCAILAGQVLSISPFPFTRDSTFYAISIVLLAGFVADGKIMWFEALLLLCAYLVYVAFMSQNTKVAKLMVAHGQRKSISGTFARKLSDGYLKTDMSNMPAPNFGDGEGTPTPKRTLNGAAAVVEIETVEVKTDDAAEEEDDKSMLCKCFGFVFKIIRLPYSILFTASMPPCLERKIPNYFFMWQFCWSIIWIAGLTYVMLLATSRVGCILGIPSVVMGMVVISAGTTVPDCLSSIIVSRAGQGDMAVCNAIGSNIFNIFIGLGLPWLLYTLVYSEPYESIALEGIQVLLSILILVIYLFILMIVLIISKWKLFPAVGGVLIFLHLLFIAWALLTNNFGDTPPVIKLPGWEDKMPDASSSSSSSSS
jgi:sodium/potassium/calcium exchanger 4/sodium/potassium/calcium exchanger 5